MQHYILCLTKEEANKFTNCGWNFIKNNTSRLVAAQDALAENFVNPGYLRETNRIVYSDVVYTIYKDYVDIAGNRRVFLLKPCLDGCDIAYVAPKALRKPEKAQTDSGN